MLKIDAKQTKRLECSQTRKTLPGMTTALHSSLCSASLSKVSSHHQLVHALLQSPMELAQELLRALEACNKV